MLKNIMLVLALIGSLVTVGNVDAARGRVRRPVRNVDKIVFIERDGGRGRLVRPFNTDIERLVIRNGEVERIVIRDSHGRAVEQIVVRNRHDNRRVVERIVVDRHGNPVRVIERIEVGHNHNPHTDIRVGRVRVRLN